MSGVQSKRNEKAPRSRGLLLFLTILFGVLLVLFHQSLDHSQILFANDGPLGAMKADNNSFPGVYLGHWSDLSWLGAAGVSAAPTLTSFFESVFSPELFMKTFAPLSLLFLGFSVWLLFRQLRFAPMVCVVGGLAAGLNMHFFSTACWGQGTWNMSTGSMFLAMAALVSPNIRQAWARAALAGLAVGMGVMEGFDVGAILSIYVGIFAFFVIWAGTESVGTKVVRTLWQPAMMVCFAGLIAVHTVVSLVDTQITGIVGTGQSATERAAKWNGATQWSLPKLEAFRLLIPGSFGYRLDVYIHDADRSSQYWGRIAEDAQISLLESKDPEVRRKFGTELGLPADAINALGGNDPGSRLEVVEGLIGKYNMLIRHSGSGEYAGVLVAILALFGLANSVRGPGTPFSVVERHMVWFWGLVAGISLLLAFGRHGFLYQYLYQLPYSSTIRNPIKFLFPFHIAWILLAGYGMEGLHRRYLQSTVSRRELLPVHVSLWLKKAVGFEKYWVWVSALTLAGIIVVAIVLVSFKNDLIAYLVDHVIDPTLAPRITTFFYGELLWFILYFGLYKPTSSQSSCLGNWLAAGNSRRS